MIKRDFYKTRTDGANLYKTYSDQNVYIKKVATGELYSSAIDIAGSPNEYEETEILIPEDESNDEI